MKNLFSPKELELFKNICKLSNSRVELKERIKKEFPNKKVASVLAYARRNKLIEHFKAVHLSSKEKELPGFLKSGPKTLEEVSVFLDVPKEEVFPTRDKFAELGYNIEIKDSKVSLISEPQPGEPQRHPKITSNKIKVLFLSDICFGLKTQQPTLLQTAYEIGEREGVWFAVIAGNIVAGKPEKKREKDYFLLTSGEQLDYAKTHLPKASFKTTFINGPKDLSWETGEDSMNIGEELAKARKDLSYLADYKATLPIGKKEKVKIGVMCASGNNPYTKSYTLQGMAENLQEAEHYVFEHSDSLQMILIGGIQTALLDPRRFPPKQSRINDFDKVAIPALHRIPTSQSVSKRRGGSHVLGFVIVSFELNDEGYLENIPVCEFYNFTSYFKENDYLLNPSGELTDKSLSKEEKDLLNLLAEKSRRKGSLSRRLGISEEHVDEIVEDLNRKKFKISFNKATKSIHWTRPLQEEFKPLDVYISKFFGEKSDIKRAKTVNESDTHLGHKHERPDLIKTVYNVAESEKADAVLHAGDVFEGEDSYKGQTRELVFHGADAQLNHGLRVWPESKIPTFIIMGSSHEKIFLDKCGFDIVGNFARLARAEKNLNLTALKTADGITGSRGVVDINGIKFCIDHPSGGIPYGRSYRPQKLIENLVSEMELEGDARVIILGHLHVSLFMLYKGVAGFLNPCLQDKTKYIEAKGYTPWIGFWVTEIITDQFNNIIKVVPKYFPFEPKKKPMPYQVVSSKNEPKEVASGKPEGNK